MAGLTEAGDSPGILPSVAAVHGLSLALSQQLIADSRCCGMGEDGPHWRIAAVLRIERPSGRCRLISVWRNYAQTTDVIVLRNGENICKVVVGGVWFGLDVQLHGNATRTRDLQLLIQPAATG